MKDLNKHKPLLSKAELLKLLEEKSSTDNDLTELDDFEKEAFEGFANYTTPEKAEKLMNDIDFQLSRTINEDNKSDKKVVLWISMAASIALIIGLSFLFINQSEVLNNKDIALNTEELKTKNYIPENNAKLQELAKDEATPIVETKNKPQESYKATTNVEKKESSNSKNTPITDASIATVGKTSNESAMYLDAEKKEEESVMQVYSTNGGVNNADKIENQPSVAAATNYQTENQNQITTAGNDDLVMEKDSKKSFNKSASMPEAKSQANSQTNYNKPFYKTGDKDIRNYILEKEKLEPFTEKLIGKFAVSVLVKTNGTIKVTTIQATKKSDEKFLNYLKDILNSMSGWNASIKNGQFIESNYNFVLSF